VRKIHEEAGMMTSSIHFSDTSQQPKQEHDTLSVRSMQSAQIKSKSFK